MINLTHQAITIQTPTGAVTIQPSGSIARVTTTEVVVGESHGVPVVTRTFGEPEGLPEEGTECLVSGLVLAAVPGRKGVFAPDTGPTAVRENGQIIAVTRLIAA